MADSKVEKTEVAAEECPLKEKKVDETTKENEEVAQDEEAEETTKDKVENGDVNEKNGKQDAEEEKEDVCEKTACKRKSAGGDAPDGTPAEGTPEKKQKVEDGAPTEEEAKTEEVAA